MHVGTEEGVERAQTKAHLAYAVEDSANWRIRLQQEGIAILEGVPIPGFDRFEFIQPIGA